MAADPARITARILIETESVLFRPEDPFELTSGRTSPVYIDCRRLISFPRARGKLMDMGAELIEEAIDLPSFRHPRCAAYILGPERGQLSAQLLQRCVQVVRIPTHFCINVATAGAIVMYDRLITMGRFAERPVTAHGAANPPPNHVYGAPRRRS